MSSIKTKGLRTPINLEYNYKYEPSRILPQHHPNIYGPHGEVLGEGSYGKVVALTDVYALKQIIINKNKRIDTATLREIAILIKVDHPNVIVLHDVFREKINRLSTLNLILPRASMDLRQFIHEFNPSQRDIKDIFYQITSGLHYLHINNIIHRDIKPDNILAFKEGFFQIADFGLSMTIGCFVPTGLTHPAYTLPYRSPEVASEEDYGFPSDIWALGCSIYEIYTKERLFNVIDDDSLIYKISLYNENNIPKRRLEEMNVPNEAIRLILSCLNMDPIGRISAHKIIESFFFDEVRNEKTETPLPRSCIESLEYREAYPKKSYSQKNTGVIFSYLYKTIINLSWSRRIYFHAVWLYDMMQHAPSSVRKNNEWLIAGACLLIAAKYGGPSKAESKVKAKTIQDSLPNVYKYEEKEIEEMSFTVLRYIGYDISHSLTYDFLHSHIYLRELDEDIIEVSEDYLILLTMTTIRFDILPGDLSFLALDLANFYLNEHFLKSEDNIILHQGKLIHLVNMFNNEKIPIEMESAEDLIDAIEEYLL